MVTQFEEKKKPPFMLTVLQFTLIVAAIVVRRWGYPRLALQARNQQWFFLGGGNLCGSCPGKLDGVQRGGDSFGIPQARQGREIDG